MTELIIVVALCLTHLAAPQLLRLSERVLPDPAPVAHGLAIAFVFLHLIPEIGDGLASRGLALAWLLLVGFLAFSAVDVWVQASRRAPIRLALQVGLAAILSWLIGASLPEAVSDDPAQTVVVLLAAAMHLLEQHHRHMEGGQLGVHLRIVLAVAVAAGLVADELWAEHVRTVDNILVAIVSGGILLTVFRDHFELDVADRRFSVLAVAALGYGAVLSLAAVG